MYIMALENEFVLVTKDISDIMYDNAKRIFCKKT